MRPRDERCHVEFVFDARAERKDFTLTITVAFGGSTRAYTLNVDAVETYPDPAKSTVVPPAVTTVKPTAFALSITAFTGYSRFGFRCGRSRGRARRPSRTA